MGFADKSAAKMLNKAMALYLPTTQTAIIQLTIPKSVSALRVWHESDSARDYFVSGGYWFQITADSPFEVRAYNLRIPTGTGMQLIAATIAEDIARYHRPRLWPLKSDLYPFQLTVAALSGPTRAI